MKFSKGILNLFYIIVLFSNCVREFDPPLQGYQNLLVVEAILTDGEDQFEVKLSRSTPIDTSAFIPETGANVSISNETGELFTLQETDDKGIYSYQGLINAQVGKSYQIHIKTINGNTYESTPVTMRKTPEIDSVTFRFEPKPSAGVEGVQIYVNTHDSENITQYYRWGWEETWQFRTPYNSSIYWDNGEIKDREEPINICWKFDNSTSIDIFSTSNLSMDRVADFPLLYVDTNTDRLKSKYSILVKQYALSEESYNYWKELEKATENLGTLFDSQPTIIKGNIYNINNENEIVLGYFDVSTLEEKRIFITRGDLPLTRFPNNYWQCVDSLVSPSRVEEMINAGWSLVEFTPLPPPPIYQFSDQYCIDCTLYGTNIKPDYWD